MAYTKQRQNKYFDAFNKGYVASSNVSDATQLIDTLQKSTLPTLEKIQNYKIDKSKGDAVNEIALLESQGKDSKTILNEIKEGKHPELAGKYVNKTVQYHLGRVEANKQMNIITKSMEAGDYNFKEDNLDIFLKPYLDAQDFDNRDDTYALGFASEFTPYKSKLMAKDAENRGKFNYETKILDGITMVENLANSEIKNGYFQKLNSIQYDMISSDGKTVSKMYSNDDVNKIALQHVENIIDGAVTTDQLKKAELILQANRGTDNQGKILQSFMSSNKPEVVALKKSLFAKQVSLENIEAARKDRNKSKAIAEATKEYLVENDPEKKLKLKKAFIEKYGDSSSSFLQDVNAAESLLEDIDEVKRIQKDVEMGKYNYKIEELNQELKGVRISTASLEKILDKQSAAEQVQNSFYTPPRQNEKYQKTVKDITVLLADKLKPNNSKFDTGKAQILIADIVKQDFGDAWQEWNEKFIKPPRTATREVRDKWEKDAQAWLDNEYLNIIKKYDNENWLSGMTAKMENTTIIPPMAPTTVARPPEGESGSAVIATKPANAPFRAMVRSAFPNIICEVIRAASSPPAAAAFVFTKTVATAFASSMFETISSDPPLNPNQPIQSTRVPRAAKGILAPGIAFEVPSSLYFPNRGPIMSTPASAAEAPHK